MNIALKIIVAIITLTFSVTASAENSTVMRRLPIDVVDTGGTLIFSDSPEYVTQNGILYTDTVKGDARILFYHLNDTGYNKRLAVVVENVSKHDNKIEITRGGFSVPSNDFLLVGKSTQHAYMQGNFHDTIHLARGERKLFQNKISHTVIPPGHLIYGVYDFHTSGTVRITVLMCPANANPLRFIDHADILPKDQYRLRGTFKNMNRVIRLRNEYDPRRNGIGYILICDDVTDFFKRGIDATDGSEVVNRGNYGINYILNFRTKAMTKFRLTPLGGMYAGVMRFNYGGKSGTIQTPKGRLYFGDRTPPEPESVKKAREAGLSLWTNFAEYSELGSYNGNVSFEYSPPGASNLPVNIILMPTE